MKWKKILSLLMVAVIVSSLFAVLGSNPATADQYVQKIRLEVRMDQGVGVGDAATGVLDAFLQSVEGPVYDGVRAEWKAQLSVLESYGSYNNMYYNTATTGGYAEVDTNNDGNLDYFNPWNIREIRYSTNWLINRQQIVEDIYDGYGIAQYSAIGQRNPAWDEMFQPLMDARGITYSGNFDTANDMIQDAMTEAMNHDDLEGELRAPANSTTDFWQYRPPGGDWKDVETLGLIRTEDRRNDIGHQFSDDLEDCGIKVDRDDVDRTAVNTWLWSDASEMQWGWYTGGWIASAAVAYQHAGCAQMYTHYYPYMPGDAFEMYIGGSRYSYHTHDPAADELFELANPLMSGQVPDEDTYWVMFQDLLDRGVHESVRVFIQTSIDFIPINRDAVTEVATDVVTGWSQVISPRTIKTDDGEFIAAQFSSTGALYMDNWNNIAGFSDYYSVMQSRMSRDYATMMHPAKGVPISMRADIVEVMRDYEYDADGNLTKSLAVPEDAVNYDVFTEEWSEVGADVEAATAVEYKWHFGTWHSGHDFNMQDLVAYYAWSKQICWETDAGDHYYVGSWKASQPFYNNIQGIVFDEATDTVTVYGDYTFPTDPQVGGYYMWMPEVPWQQYEAVSQLIGLTDLAPAQSELLNEQAYRWSSGPGTNYVHWLSSSQGEDFDATLANMATAKFVPPYLKAENGCPIPLDAADVGADIDDIRTFYTDYEHFWITHGPFKLTLHDPSNLVIEFERWTETDGYPWPDNYWRDKLSIARLRLGTLTAPRRVTIGTDIDLQVRARVAEEYPVKATRDLTDSYDYTVSATLSQDGAVVWETDEVTLTDSYFDVTVPGADLDPGLYEARITAYLEGQIAIEIASAGLQIVEVEEPIPEGIENFDLSINPISGKAPLEVTITASADNVGETAQTVSVFIDGSSRYTLDIPAGESGTLEETHTFNNAGDYLVGFGDQSAVVSVEAEETDGTPGFAFALMAISLITAVAIYHKKKEY